MALRYEMFDVVVIGGGIAGNALAAVMARAGRAVLVLERSIAYRDRVRGEVFHAWGVAEARRLGLHEALVNAGGMYHSRFVPYDETVTPAEAVAASILSINSSLRYLAPWAWDIRRCARRSALPR